MVQISHPNVTTGKTMALTRLTFLGKEMFLLFNMLSRFVIPYARGQGQWPKGATTCPRSGAAHKRNYPTTKEQWLRGSRRAERSYSMVKVRRGSHEEILLIQGKDQQLCFAGTSIKRYSTSKVRETQVRQ